MKLKTSLSIFAILLMCGCLSTHGQGLSPSTATEPTPVDPLERQRVAASVDSQVFLFSRAQLHQMGREAAELINRERLKLGLTAIAWSEDAARIARLHSENMARLNFFGHSGVDGKMVDERADQLGVKKWRAIGENIAFNRGYRDPIRTAVDKWMLSTSHRNNLLNPRWQETGIGIAVTPEGCFYFTQVFLVRR
ncbi:MAG TPA: CAP domain-containing protein [Pyrinomonadaceae bacterium]|nr:CAP domain-containing protein [Pyrinomonadaceae bacterium]HNU06589.1 CAP domain-containing protein [Pyrinomonadaceae bacterium]